jgi:hypothetical protein
MQLLRGVLYRGDPYAFLRFDGWTRSTIEHELNCAISRGEVMLCLYEEEAKYVLTERAKVALVEEQIISGLVLQEPQ